MVAGFLLPRNLGALGVWIIGLDPLEEVAHCRCPATEGRPGGWRWILCGVVVEVRGRGWGRLGGHTLALTNLVVDFVNLLLQLRGCDWLAGAGISQQIVDKVGLGAELRPAAHL